MTAFNPYEAPQSAVGEQAAPAKMPAGVVGHSPAMVEALRRTRPWILVLGVLGFIMCGLMVLGGLMVILGAALAGTTGTAGIGVGQALAIGAVYLIFGAGSFLFAWLLVRYSSAISRLLSTDATEDFEQALEAQRLLWKVIGISTIAYIGLSFLAGIAIVLFAMVTAMGSF